MARCFCAAPRAGFGAGYTPVVSRHRASSGAPLDMRMSFGIHRLRRGERVCERSPGESLWVLLHGNARVTVAGRTRDVARASLFDEGPVALHTGGGEPIEVFAQRGASEWAVVRTPNDTLCSGRLYGADECTTEDRGAGLVQGACRRFVRTIFDHATRPDSNLVVGEVVNLPGRWSSYPPHHHPQPEIYHYRFTREHGYGHAEVGETVFKVRDGDTTCIPGGLDHAQVSAPGYGMYYLWIVRHLPRRPYTGFTFTPAHRWLLDPQHQGWQPAQVPSP